MPSLSSSSYNLRNRTTSSQINKTNGQLVSFTVEKPNQNEAPLESVCLPISMPALIPISSTSCLASSAHNDEQSMLWKNVASLFVKCEDNHSNIDGLRGEYEQSIKELKEFTVELYARLQSARGEIAAVKTNSKNKLKSFKKAFHKKIKKAKQVSASSACDADMEVFKYIDTLRIQIDELRETTERQNAKIEELTRVSNDSLTSDLPNVNNNSDIYDDIYDDFRDLNLSMNNMREELADLNELYENDYYRFFQREEEMKEAILAAQNESMNANKFAIQAKNDANARIDLLQGLWGENFYKLEDKLNNMERDIRNEIEDERVSSEYWIEHTLNTFQKEKLSHIHSQIANVRSYADTKVAGDLREEFVSAICREVTFESNTRAELVQGVHNELTAMTQGVRDELLDLVTRSNEIHTARYFQTTNDMQLIKDDSINMCQTLKRSIGLVDMELSDVKDILEDQKEEIKETIYSEMDADYYALKKYIRHKMRNHLHDEHPEEEDEHEQEQDEQEQDEQEQDNETSAVTEDSQHENVGEEVSKIEDNNEDIVIIVDFDNSRISEDDE